MRKLCGAIPGFLFIVLGAGCGPSIQRNPVPESLVDSAHVQNLEDVRYWGDSNFETLNSLLLESRWESMGAREQHYLAISGGGENGAYGAGFLNGWTAAGTRPEFTMVTGISTGALIAPFAFLGPDYDDKIEYFYTEFSTDDLVRKRSPISIWSQVSAFDTSLLREKIEQFIDVEVMQKIAAEYRNGRLLLIGTTNLDAGRAVVWSIGRIASSGDPKALDLIHQIILASASIGAAFPPVLIEVEADGEIYDEMHVDGGTVNQVFVYPMSLDWGRIMEQAGMKDRPKVYILRNAWLQPRHFAAEYKLTDIIARSLGSLIRTQSLGDIQQIFLETQRDGLDFYLTYIPDEFDDVAAEPFDQAYMKKLYELGFDQALSDQAWERFPPGYEDGLNR